MSQDDIKILSHKTLAQSFYRMDCYDVEIPCKGAEGTLLLNNRDILVMKNAVSVLPYYPEDDVVLLVEQFRLGAHLSIKKGWSIEAVAGHIDAGETAAEAALREAREETGAELTDLVFIAQSMPIAASTTEVMDLYCGRVKALPDQKFHGLRNEGEYLILHITPFDQALAWLREGMIFNSKTIIALQWLQIHHDEIREKWLTG